MFIIMAEYFITCLFSLSIHSWGVAYHTKVWDEVVETPEDEMLSPQSLSKC